jgi:P27 family predicted phage terminase small subunit
MLQRGRKSKASLAAERVVTPFPQPVQEFTPPDPPAHLGKTERQIWRDINNDFNLSTAAAQHVLTTALEAHQRARECREAVARDGMRVPARDGQMKVHPLLAVERDARQAWLAGLKTLGLEL